MFCGYVLLLFLQMSLYLSVENMFKNYKNVNFDFESYYILDIYYCNMLLVLYLYFYII